MNDDFKMFSINNVNWRYKTLICDQFNKEYYYAEIKTINDSDWKDHLNKLLPDDKSTLGYRKNARLMLFEHDLRSYQDMLDNRKISSSLKKGKVALIGDTKPFQFYLSNEYKKIMIDASVTLAAYINEAIREKLIKDGLLTDQKE